MYIRVFNNLKNNNNIRKKKINKKLIKRNYIINNFQINEIIDFGNELVFEDANVFCSIINCSKRKQIT